MGNSAAVLQLKNNRAYFRFSVGFWSTGGAKLSYTVGEKIYCATAVQLLLASVGGVAAGVTAVLLLAMSNKLRLAVSSVGVLSLLPFVLFASFLLLSVLQWLPFRLLPWKLRAAGKEKPRKPRLENFIIAVPELCFLLAAVVMIFLVSQWRLA